MLFTKVLTLILALALSSLTSANPVSKPAFQKRQFTNSTTTTAAGTGALLMARGTGTGVALMARNYGTGTGAILIPRITGKPAFSKRQFSNTTSTSTTAAGTGAVLVPRGTGTGAYLVARGTGTGTPS